LKPSGTFAAMETRRTSDGADSDYVPLPGARGSNRIFEESKSVRFLRVLSFIADEQTVNKLGDRMGPGTAVVFMLNSLTGLSLLTLPFGFAQTGLLLGAVTVLLCMAMSYITATFMLEALTIANALNYEKAEDKAIEKHGIRERLHKEKLTYESTPGAKEVIEKRDTLDLFKDEVRAKNAVSEFKIRERVELGAMGQAVLTSRMGRWGSTAIYVIILSFTYGTAAALVVTVSESLGHTAVSAAALIGLHPPAQNTAYTASVIFAFFTTLPLCFTNLQKTKKFTIGIMILRFLAIGIILVVASVKSFQRISTEGFSNVVQSIPMWRPEGFVAVFGNSIFLCCLHHYLPSMISPLDPQEKAPGVIMKAFSICYLLMIAICTTALMAWNAETSPECSSDPGGNYCRIQPLYNLNFAPLAWGDGVVALFLLAYPAMALSAIPIAAITTRNTVGQWLGIAPPDPEAPYTTSNILLTLSVVVPPFTVALLTTDVQAVIQYVGGYAGLSVSFIVPLILLRKCRQALSLDRPHFKGLYRPLKSMFGNRCGYLLVVLAYLFALVLVTKKLFF